METIYCNAMNYRERLAREIAGERVKRNIKQGDLAKIVNVSAKTISNIESANYDGEVRLKTIQDICDYLNIEVVVKLGSIE